MSKSTDFLVKLQELNGSAGNVTLRKALGWDEVSYEKVKEELLRSRKILPGKGKGGSVKLAGEATGGSFSKESRDTALTSDEPVRPSEGPTTAVQTSST